ncbi:MAG: DUF6941 family protein [Planctomycetota bacterium]|jgi:hypothetical protein
MAQQSPVAPVVLTLLLCEKVIVDARTQQYSLVGLVSNVNASRFPVRSPNLCIFTEVTGGHGVTGLTVRIVDVDENREPVVKLDLQLNLENPLFVFGMPPLVFPEPGDYRLQALSGGSRLLEKRLILRDAKGSEIDQDE